MEATSLPRARALALPRRILSAFDDERLVEHLRRGNVAAFEVIYERHHRGILAYSRHLLGSLEEAEDAVQQTFASAYNDLLASNREIRLKAWLYTIARNRCLSMLRARREYAAELQDPETAGLAEEVEHRADLRALLADLHDLPEPQRAALVLSEVADLSHTDIADVLGCDVAKVKSLVFQARSGLIERRDARETPCTEIREQLSTLRGGSLRRGPLRRHLKACPGCSAYREEVRRQRQMLALVLPVIPSLGLKESVFAAVGLGSAGATSATVAGSAAAGAVAAKAGLAKVAVAVVAGSAALGGGTAAVTGGDFIGGGTSDPAIEQQGNPTSGSPAGAGAPGAAPAAGEEAGKRGRGDEQGERRARRRHGIDPLTGEHRGEHGRDNARSRGRGKKLGLYKPEPPRGRAEPRARSRRRAQGRTAPPVTPRRTQPQSEPVPTEPIVPLVPETPERPLRGRNAPDATAP